MVAPVHKQELSQATDRVILSPCGHKIAKVAAEQLYGSIKGGQCSKTKHQCIKCHKIVINYFDFIPSSQKILFQMPNNCGYFE